MRLVTKNIIRRIFQDIAEAFYQINSFGYGPADEFVQKAMDEDDQELEGTIIYPRLYVTPEPSTITGKRINRNYTIVVADLVRKGRENMTEAESDTEQILTDVIAQIQDQAYGFILDVNSITIVPFTGRFVDEVTGHYAEVSLYSGFEFDRCQIPSEFISISNPYIPLDEEGTNERDPLSWHKTGNTLTASSVIGSNNDQDWRLIHNNVTIATIQAAGVKLDVLNARATPASIFLTTEDGVIKSRTAAEVRSDIGAGTGSVTSVGLIAGSAGSDVNVSGSPITGAGDITINIPSASATARGLVTTAAQAFAGVKTFNNDITLLGNIIDGGAANADIRISGTDSGRRLEISTSTTGVVLTGVGNVTRALTIVGGSTSWSVSADGHVRGSLNGGVNLCHFDSVGFAFGFNTTPSAMAQVRGKLNTQIALIETSSQAAIIDARESAGVRILGFFGNAPVARPVVPTGSTTDTLITALQNLGLISQT